MDSRKIIFEWLDNIFAKKIPDEVEALYINLVEWPDTLQVEFFGIGPFDKDDKDWACDYIFSTKNTEIPFSVADGWKKALKDVSSIIGEYVISKNSSLSNIKRIGVGFGDSETVLVKDEI